MVNGGGVCELGGAALRANRRKNVPRAAVCFIFHGEPKGKVLIYVHLNLNESVLACRTKFDGELSDTQLQTGGGK